MEPMEQVREGMRVLDRSGDEVGNVEELKLGDRQAVTAEGQTGSDSGNLIDEVTNAIAGPDIPPQLAERLLRTGYIKIDSKGLFKSDCYAGADRVERVEGETVHLNVDRADLVS